MGGCWTGTRAEERRIRQQPGKVRKYKEIWFATQFIVAFLSSRSSFSSTRYGIFFEVLAVVHLSLNIAPFCHDFLDFFSFCRVIAHSDSLWCFFPLNFLWLVSLENETSVLSFSFVVYLFYTFVCSCTHGFNLIPFLCTTNNFECSNFNLPRFFNRNRLIDHAKDNFFPSLSI